MKQYFYMLKNFAVFLATTCPVQATEHILYDILPPKICNKQEKSLTLKQELKLEDMHKFITQTASD